MEKKELESIIEGILFTMGDSVDPSKIAAALEIEKDEVIEIKGLPGFAEKVFNKW